MHLLLLGINGLVLEITKADIYDLLATFGEDSNITFRLDCTSTSHRISKKSNPIKLVTELYNQPGSNPILFHFNDIKNGCPLAYNTHPSVVVNPAQIGFSSVCNDLKFKSPNIFTFECDVNGMPT